MKQCECGCQEMIPAFDDRGRPRRFVQGHQKLGKFKQRDVEMIQCNCGCGAMIESIDPRGRPRKFAWGHATRVREYPDGYFDYMKGNSFGKGNIPWNKGIEWEAMSGENNPGWKSGAGYVEKEKQKIVKDIEIAPTAVIVPSGLIKVRVRRYFAVYKFYPCSNNCGKMFYRRKESKRQYCDTCLIDKTGYKKGYESWNKGLNWAPPNVELFAEAGKKTQYKEGQMAKEKHPKWKGGITDENKLLRTSARYRKWRTAIFVRDNFTCVKCGQVGGKLAADHIKGWAKYPLLRFELSNGRTLCKACHDESTYKLKEFRD